MITAITEKLNKSVPDMSDERLQRNDSLNKLEQKSSSKVDKHIVIVENSEGSFFEDSWATVIKKKVADNLKKVPVHKAVLNKKGQECIFLPREKNKDEAMISLEKDFKMTPGKPFVPKKLLPKIKIHNLDSLKFDQNEDMKKTILEKNIELRACLENNEKSLFELLFIAKNQNGTSKYAIVKVTPDVRNLILTTGKIFIEMSSHRVSDHFHVEQCYKCQGYGHRSASKLCPLYNSNESICLYCAGKHKSKLCPLKKDTNQYNCCNCQNSRSKEIKKLAKSHTSTSSQCPTLQRELNRVKEINDTNTKN